jgi:hypothetical protein
VFIQRRHGPVIDDQNVNAAKSCQEVTQAPIGIGLFSADQWMQ